MSPEQLAQYDALTSIPARALFLLDLGVTAKLDIVELTPVYRAFAGGAGLPVTGETEGNAIDAGIAWLNSKATE